MMTEYRVSIWASVNVEAKTEEQARDIAYELVRNQELKMRDYEFTAEERD